MFDVSRVLYFIFAILLYVARGTAISTELKFVANFPLLYLREAIATRGSNIELSMWNN
jgi:hypothetical protein